MKKIDLLKVSASPESGEVEARLEGQGRMGSEGLFPESFAAAGVNGGIRFADIRVQTDG